ncbi:phospholipase D3 [Scaptodrosophila lebanonensis]|uniref:Phospholipase D3 n=1 Tax=Drosophila lebanonensis TaxID=7225 RepID=A0A6J2TZK9_DROLE|nr:phospholipase D3 [Scaptodrosophila lebanonensis]
MIPIIILFVLVLIVLLLPLETLHRNAGDGTDNNKAVPAPLPCELQLVETLPIGLSYTQNSPKFMGTYEAWKLLLDKAKLTVDIAAPYWTLRGIDVNDSSTQPGDHIFHRLLANGDGGKPKLRIRIAMNKSQESILHADAKILANYDAAEVVAVKLPNAGVLNAKLWIVDGQHFYLGSANMDWRSLTQVKELGVLAQNCPHLAHDVGKIFNAYWELGSNGDGTIPSQWHWTFDTRYRLGRPMLLNVNKNYTMQAYISSTPVALTTTGRTHDLDAILNVIESAAEFINIAVMDYFPLIINGPNVQFWPPIDNALRRAAVDRGVAIKMLVSWWPNSHPSEDNFLRSLQEFSQVMQHVDIQIRRFIVPVNDELEQIPLIRFSHNSFMVSDKIAYIGASNWTGEFFMHSAGIGLVLADTTLIESTIRTDLFKLFMRDWYSPYSLALKRNLQI